MSNHVPYKNSDFFLSKKSSSYKLLNILYKLLIILKKLNVKCMMCAFVCRDSMSNLS